MSLPYVLDDAHDEEVAKAALIESQWPKLHKCKDAGGTVVKISPDDWRGLELYAITSDSYATYDWRHCRNCRSTLMAITDIHSIDAL